MQRNKPPKFGFNNDRFFDVESIEILSMLKIFS